MTDYGRGDSHDAGGSGARYDPDKYVLGKDGKPLVDRYGRPVRRRPQATPSPKPQAPRQNQPRRRPRSEAPQATRFDLSQDQPPRQERPRQERPRQQAPRQQRPVQQAPLSSREQDLYAEPVPRQRRPKPAPRRARAKRRGPGCFGIFGALIAILVVLAIVVTLWADARLNRVDATPAQQVSDTAGTNWLLVGSDSRQGLSEEEIAELGTGGDMGVGRTDTIMLLHLPVSGQARLVSIPRDSLVTIPGYGENKINASFAFGGPELLTETVESETGLHIDHYAEIGMGGLAVLVDSVGGVEICVDYPIQDPLANLDVQAGCQEMDGATALGYVRTRATPQGDLDRVERQRQFFSSLMDELTAPATLLNPFRALSLVGNASATFTVGTNDHVWHLLRVALSMRGGVSTETVPFSGFLDTSVGNVVLWDEAGAEALWESMR